MKHFKLIIIVLSIICASCGEKQNKKTETSEIAEAKMPDLNANDVEAAMKIIAGSAKNMGITIVN